MHLTRRSDQRGAECRWPRAGHARGARAIRNRSRHGGELLHVVNLARVVRTGKGSSRWLKTRGMRGSSECCSSSRSSPRSRHSRCTNPCSTTRRVPRRWRPRHQDLPRRVARAPPDHRQRRHGRCAVPDRAAAERDPLARLRHRPSDRIRLHRSRDPLRARDREPALRRSQCLGTGRLVRGAQGLDVPPRPRLHRRLGERADPRLPDAQITPRAALDGDAGARSAGR